MRHKTRGVDQILVGLQLVGVTRFKAALDGAVESGLSDREAIVDLLIDTLEADNYIRDRRDQLLRTALWREYLRHVGEDFSEFLSEIRVTVRGEPGQERDQFVEALRSVLAEFELKPVVDLAGPSEDGANPQLLVDGHAIVRGYRGRQDLKTAIGKNISGW